MQKLRTASPETGSRPEWGWREEATGPKRGLFSALAAGSGADSSLQMDRQSKGALPSPARAMFASFIPTLEIWPTTGPGGPTTVLQHARVVYRYLSKVYGLAGRSQAESDAVDMIVEESDCMYVAVQTRSICYPIIFPSLQPRGASGSGFLTLRGRPHGLRGEDGAAVVRFL